MKQFLTVLRYEYAGYLKNKVFIIVTVLFSVLILGGLSLPSIMGLFSGLDTGTSGEEKTRKVLVYDQSGFYDSRIFDGLPSLYQFTAVPSLTEEEARAQIQSDEIYAAVIIDQPQHYTLYVDQLSMDAASENYIGNLVFQAIDTEYKLQKMQDGGLSAEQAEAVLTPVESNTVETSETSFLSGYMLSTFMTLILYMTILMYGQLVATSVAGEKSSRAMEMLITSAKTNNLLFGKVLGACMAGFTQLAIFFVVAVAGFLLNRSALSGYEELFSILASSGGQVGYMFLFYFLGFFMYAFLFGALGSLASRTEDINTTSMPITLLFVVGFLVSMPTTSESVMQIASFIPFFTPMAMFSRICMGYTTLPEIWISVVLTTAVIFLICLLSAKIYRLGVLMYGKPPKLGELVKMLREQKKY